MSIRWVYKMILVALLLPLGLASCRVEGDVALATSDLIDVVAGKNLSAPIELIMVAMISEENADKEVPDITSALSVAWPDVKYHGFKKGYDGVMNALIFKASVPVVPMSENLATNSPITVVVGKNQSDIHVGLIGNPAKIEQVRAAMVKKKPMAKVSDRSIMISASIQNDLKDDVKVSPGLVINRGVPQFSDDAPIVLKRREDVKFELGSHSSLVLLKRGNKVVKIGSFVAP